MNVAAKEEDYHNKPQSFHFCLVQLTRMGDIVQTFQAAYQFQQHNPDVKLSLVARRSYVQPLRFLLEKVFDHIYDFDGPSLIDTDSLTHTRQHILKFLNQIGTSKPDLIVNLSFCQTSSYLCELINCKLKMGLTRKSPKILSVKDKWSQYVYSSVMANSFNTFSLVDIFRNFLQSDIEITPTIRQENKTRRIGLHPFASQAKKMWYTHKWSEVIYQVLKKDNQAIIEIFGASSESLHAKKIIDSPLLKNFKHRIVNSVGQTNLEELTAKLKECQLFVGHDSLVGHLAAVSGVQSLTLSLGTVRPHETTPYGHKNYVLFPKTECFPCFVQTTCENYQCHSDIPYRVVSDAILQLLSKNQIIFDSLIPKLHPTEMEQFGLYETALSSSGLSFKELSPSTNLRSVFISVYNLFWQFYLKENEVEVCIPNLDEKTAFQLNKYIEGLENYYELNHFAQDFCRRIQKELESKTPNISVIQEFSNKLGEIDAMNLSLKKPFPYLAPLCDYFHVKKANLDGNGLFEISQNALFTYHQYGLAISLLYELLSKIVSKHKNNNLSQAKLNHISPDT